MHVLWGFLKCCNGQKTCSVQLMFLYVIYIHEESSNVNLFKFLIFSGLVQVAGNMERIRFTKASNYQQMVKQENIYWESFILYAIRKTDQFALLNFNSCGMMQILIINLHQQDYISVPKVFLVDGKAPMER